MTPQASIAVLVTTFDRVDDARANLEIIRSGWGGFQPAAVVHAFNGEPAWYRSTGLEDLLVEVPPGRSHFTGAAGLIDHGIAALNAHFPQIRYLVCLASDCWIYQPNWLRDTVSAMAARQHRLAAASWHISEQAAGVRRQRQPQLLPGAGLSTDVFIVDLPWAMRHALLPLAYDRFINDNADVLNYFHEIPLLERYLEGKLLGAVRRQLLAEGTRKDPWGSEGLRRARAALYLVEERAIDPTGRTAPSHKGHWPSLALVTSEDPQVKRAVALANPNLHGPTLARLRTEPDTSWFNAGARVSGRY